MVVYFMPEVVKTVMAIWHNKQETARPSKERDLQLLEAHGEV